MKADQFVLLPGFPPDPPTGPAADIPDRDANRYAAYIDWRYTREGLRAWLLLRDWCDLALQAEVRRLSINALCEQLRAQEHLAVNNTYRAWLADDLIDATPELLDVIERRKRHKPKEEE